MDRPKRVFKGISRRARTALNRDEGYDVEFKLSVGVLDAEDLVTFANSDALRAFHLRFPAGTPGQFEAIYGAAEADWAKATPPPPPRNPSVEPPAGQGALSSPLAPMSRLSGGDVAGLRADVMPTRRRRRDLYADPAPSAGLDDLCAFRVRDRDRRLSTSHVCCCLQLRQNRP